jgi:hypothetical protein
MRKIYRVFMALLCPHRCRNKVAAMLQAYYEVPLRDQIYTETDVLKMIHELLEDDG